MIYLLEDDESIRKLVMYALGTQGFETEGFDTAPLFWEAMSRKKPELVILDIMLPGEDGLSVLVKIRRTDQKLPVIMLTAKSTEYDRVEGLDAGADDYISKPFGIMELTARVKALLRRSKQTAPAGQNFGPVKIVTESREVYVNEEPVKLTLKEYELLSLLTANSDIVLTREQLLERVWGIGTEPENRTLDVHIRTLRAKLGPAGSCIQTVRGIGYKFNGKPK